MEITHNLNKGILSNLEKGVSSSDLNKAAEDSGIKTTAGGINDNSFTGNQYDKEDKEKPKDFLSKTNLSETESEEETKEIPRIFRLMWII